MNDGFIRLTSHQENYHVWIRVSTIVSVYAKIDPESPKPIPYTIVRLSDPHKDFIACDESVDDVMEAIRVVSGGDQ